MRRWGLLLVLVLAATKGFGQEKLEFDVASVRQNSSGTSPAGDRMFTNVPLGPGDLFAPTGGQFNTKNYPLMSYIIFAYKMNDGQIKALRSMTPDWVDADRFDIQARTENHEVTKDQIRLMVRSLLAERFGLAVHTEMRQENVYGMMLVKPGATGPKLKAHPAGVPCSSDFSRKEGPDGTMTPESLEAGDEGFPVRCGGILGMTASAADRYRLGARNVKMSVIANSMSSWGNLGRTVVDETGLDGLYDFVLEFTPDNLAGSAQDSGGPSFLEAAKKQMGLRFEAQTRAVPVLVLDHIERLSAN